MRLIQSLLMALLLLALPGQRAHAVEENPNARRILETIEKKLLAAKSIKIFAYVDIKEPFPRSLSGTFNLTDEGKLDADLRGTVGPDSARLLIASDGKKLDLSLNDEKRSHAQPKELRKTLLQSLLRVGLTDSLLSLSKLNLPANADGGFDDTIKVVGVQVREASAGLGYHTGEFALQFGFTVNGKPGGYAHLWISTVTGLPIRREQFYFYLDADGKEAVMRSDERYTTFIADP